MFIVGMLSWWYSRGWIDQALLVRERIVRTMDYFSVDLLLKTLFAPYRQIGASRVDGSLGVKWRAFVDRTVSRVIGSIVRAILIVIGSVAVILHSILGAVVLVLWGAVPLLPLIGLLLFLSGWVPYVWN